MSLPSASELISGSTYSDDLLEANETVLSGLGSVVPWLAGNLSRFPKYLGSRGMLAGSDGSALIL